MSPLSPDRLPWRKSVDPRSLISLAKLKSRPASLLFLSRIDIPCNIVVVVELLRLNKRRREFDRAIADEQGILYAHRDVPVG